LLGETTYEGVLELPKRHKYGQGWLALHGDMGYWDEYGYIYMQDRKKDLIISGGKILPERGGRCYQTNQRRHGCSSDWYSDEKWGEAVKAVV
jgi:acyl-CoA synthetase (AMP-forming)/AMP-acid ligase II